MHGWNLVETSDYEEWRRMRHGLLTASDVSSVMSLSPYGSRAKVAASKRGPVPGDISSSAMRGGSFLEAGVFAWFLDDLRYKAREEGYPEPVGNTCRMPGGQSMLVRHPDPTLRLAASPDGLVSWGGYALVEVKVSSPKRWAEDWAGGATSLKVPKLWEMYSKVEPPSFGKCPLRHWVQLQTQLMCTGVQRGFMVGCCGSVRLDYEFLADPAFQEHIKVAARHFASDVWPSGLDIPTPVLQAMGQEA